MAVGLHQRAECPLVTGLCGRHEKALIGTVCKERFHDRSLGQTAARPQTHRWPTRISPAFQLARRFVLLGLGLVSRPARLCRKVRKRPPPARLMPGVPSPTMWSLLFALGLVLGTVGALIAVATVVLGAVSAIARIHELVMNARVDQPRSPLH